MGHFQSASDLVRAVNAYLDGLEGKPPEDSADARRRVRELLRFREEMSAFRFQNPRFAVLELMKVLHDAMRGMDREDAREILPELKALRYAYELRRMTYDRARAAYVANRAALRIHETGLFKDLLPYLPYGGEYLAALEGYGGTVLAVYRDVLEELGVRGERVELDVEGNVTPKRAEKGIFGDRVSTEVLVSTLLRKALHRVWEDVLREERDVVPNYDRVLRYEQIVRRYNVESIASRPEKLWELLQALEEAGFIVDGDVDPEVIEGLRRRRAFRFSRVREALMGELRDFLFRYYLLTPERLRRNKPLFPGLPVTPEPVVQFLGGDADIVREKVFLEGVLQLPSAHLGAALLHIRRGVDLPQLSETYGVPLEDLRKAVDAVRAVLSGNRRVKRFVEFLRRGSGGP
ncbi:MAG TPA: hypothetical protein EYH23_00665 [Euryarchaeota archaeon]|nr:hypothetical protein [Euryarchaeota archaeon]